MAAAILNQVLNGVPDKRTQDGLRVLLKAAIQALSTQSNATAALRIKGGSASPIVQTNAVWNGIVNGVAVQKASATDCAALVGTVTNAKFNVFVISIKADGTLVSTMGTEGASLAAVKFPDIDSQAILGYVIINPTGTGNFVGGTTNLDDITVVPNAVFVNTLGAFNPNATI